MPAALYFTDDHGGITALIGAKQPRVVVAVDALLKQHGEHWFVRETVGMLRRTFARIDAQKVREVLLRQAEILATGGGNGGRLPLSQAGRIEDLLPEERLLPGAPVLDRHGNACQGQGRPLYGIEPIDLVVVNPCHSPGKGIGLDILP